MSYTAWSVTAGEVPTTSKWNIIGTNMAGFNDGTAIGTGAIVAASLGAAAVTSPAVAVGMAVQIVSTNYSAVATGTTIIPADDTIPQNTEGDQYMSQTITPKATTNRLRIEATIQGSHSASTSDLLAALFQDATSNALACDFQTFTLSTACLVLKLTHDMAAGTIAATTFKVRVGAAQSGTTTFNGQAGARRQGGVTLSNLTITEYKG